MILTGRYKFEPQGRDRAAPLMLHVEETDGHGGFRWRPAQANDLLALEPEIRDGWRFHDIPFPGRCLVS